MATCTFFGHRDCPEEIRPKLREAIVDLIDNRQANRFYVGNNGNFDAMVRATLRELQTQYPHIRYAVVLAYLPQKAPTLGEDFSDTMLPESIENVPRRFAVVWRNRWMLAQADYVVAYVTHSWGSAARFAQQAAKQGKLIAL